MLSEFKEWSYQEKVVQESEYLSSEDKKRVLAGLNQIRKILGENFLEIVVQAQHPILEYFGNTAPWTRYWLAEFGSMLSALRECPRFERLQRKLVSREDFSSAMSELDVAYKFSRAGFSIEFYPKYGRYECDFKAQKKDIEVYVEVAIVGWSHEEKRAWYIMDQFTSPYMADREVTVAGKVHKILSHPRIADIKKKLNAHIQEAKQKQDCIVLSEHGIVDLIICPKSKSDQIPIWLKKKGFSSHFEGPPYNVDEIRRARTKLSDENRQLPKDKPGMIVLNHSRLFVVSNSQELEKLVYEIEEEIYEHPNLIAGTLVFSDVIGASEAGRYGGDFAWSRRTRHDLFAENTVVIKNKFSKFPVNDEVILALIT